MSHEERIDRYLRNECSPEELAVVQRLLAEDPEFGRLFVRTATEISQLIQVAEEVQRAAASTPPASGGGRTARWIGLAAAAALLLAGLIVVQFRARPVATLARTVAPGWPAGSHFAVGAVLMPGSLTLDSGFAELAFNSGPTLILEGPATIELINGDHARLVSGRLVARVPEQAIGFAIDTPESRVTDLGTEFGVVVESAHPTQVHVLEGSVEVSTPDRANPRRLTSRQALSIDGREATAGTATPDAFMRILPPATSSSPAFVHWSFDHIVSGAIADEGTGIDGQGYDARLTTGGKGGPPEIVDGMINQALYFDGTGAYVETDFPGIADNASRTVAFWVKVPEDARRANAYAMLAWGSFVQHGATWQISWNSEPEDGPIGRLRAGVHGGQVIGSTDLRDGRWHHVAVVLFGGNAADVATHVILYLDGQLETTSQKAVQAIHTDTGPTAKSVIIGRNAGFTHPNRFFRGFIDDVVIANDALDQQQIQRIMSHGGQALR